MSLLCISKEKKTLSMRRKFSFQYVDIYFDVPMDVPECVFILKIAN